MAMLSPEMILTDTAAQKIWSLIEEEGNWDLKLRVYITGGGCSGFQYGFTFDESTQEDDYLLIKPLAISQKNEIPNVHLLVDCFSYQYLEGSEIDYEQGLQGERFIIRNPNAKTTCGCGSSFAVD